MTRPGRALGIDPGARRVGIAVSDRERRVVTPLEAVDRRLLGAAGVLSRIADLAVEWEVAVVVVGLPRSLDGSLGPAAQGAQAWAGELGGVLRERLGEGAPEVVTVDERLSTVEGARRLREAGTYGRRARSVVDATAACVLLEQWIGLGGARRGGADPPH